MAGPIAFIAELEASSTTPDDRPARIHLDGFARPSNHDPDVTDRLLGTARPSTRSRICAALDRLGKLYPEKRFVELVAMVEGHSAQQIDDEGFLRAAERLDER